VAARAVLGAGPVRVGWPCRHQRPEAHGGAVERDVGDDVLDGAHPEDQPVALQVTLKPSR
jgi:hypothetical protein